MLLHMPLVHCSDENAAKDEREDRNEEQWQAAAWFLVTAAVLPGCQARCLVRCLALSASTFIRLTVHVLAFGTQHCTSLVWCSHTLGTATMPFLAAHVASRMHSPFQKLAEQEPQFSTQHASPAPTAEQALAATGRPVGHVAREALKHRPVPLSARQEGWMGPHWLTWIASQPETMPSSTTGSHLPSVRIQQLP